MPPENNGESLYYSRAIESTMLMTLNSMTAVQNKPTVETSKQITLFLNYYESHLYAITEYKRSDMILHLYSDASYLS